VGEGGWELIHSLVEVIAKNEIIEGRREVIYRMVEACIEDKGSEVAGQTVNCVVELHT
jgi:hypothetical protein